MNITPYINFNGNAEEALNFYKQVFGGESEINRWSEAPSDVEMPLPQGWQEKIMHASFTIGEGVVLYISDSFMEAGRIGSTTITLHVEFDSEEKLRDVYDALAKEGSVNMPLDETFWGSLYANVVDKYGTAWGLEFSKK